MSKDKELKFLIHRLQIIFPHLKLWYEGEYFDDDQPQKSGKQSDVEKMRTESSFAPPKELDWFDIIKILDENGLEITKKIKI